ncbi:DDE superendonuclease family protein [Orientia tsutsugamushi str. UT144]|uniref:DDE superendonuclease family protein n=1 Tax=Orientia tsutsugamushi str. UT144 TaxID=1441384 RepID=A0A0F3RME8_ORITS|nr:DDE superendonuclease family protein [Orientia tsutsugamushi str. UT144]
MLPLLLILSPNLTQILSPLLFLYSTYPNLAVIESVGCSILFLPTYSPDLNPIEHYWFKIKNEIRKVTPQFKDISMSVEHLMKFI